MPSVVCLNRFSFSNCFRFRFWFRVLVFLILIFKVFDASLVGISVYLYLDHLASVNLEHDFVNFFGA